MAVPEKTLVAFANSTPINERAVLFIGGSNQRPHRGVDVERVDEVQRKIAEIASDKCYPPIPIEIIHLRFEQGANECHIVAVIVAFSGSRPHFAGPAYVRHGSKSMPASNEIYRELIATQLIVGDFTHLDGSALAST